MKSIRALKIMIFILLISATSGLYGKILLQAEGDYLLFSYDHSYLLGKGNIKLTFAEFTVTANQLKIDIKNRAAILGGNCRITEAKGSLGCDEIELDLTDLSMVYKIFAQKITSGSINSADKTGKIKQKPIIRQKNLLELQQSLIYFTGQKIIIATNYRVIGFNTTIYIEGMQSVSFKKLRLDKLGLNTPGAISLNKIWYSKSTGFVTELALKLEKIKKDFILKTKNDFRLNYDLFNTREFEPKFELFFNSRNLMDFSHKTIVNLNFSHKTENMSEVLLGLDLLSGKYLRNMLSASYKKPYEQDPETWLYLDSNLNLKKLGTVNLKVNYSKNDLYNTGIFYRNYMLKNINFSFDYSLSNIVIGDSAANKYSNTNFSLSYNNKLFNLSTLYSLNKDLIKGNSQVNPQVNLTIRPFTMYQGLLNFNIFSSVNINTLKNADFKDSSFRTNLGVDISSEKLNLSKSTELQFSIRGEQFIDNEVNNNYTSAGLILRGKQSFFKVVSLELLYNYHTRRKTRDWFISGTASQDLTSILKINKNNDKFKMWTSLSMDTKTGKFTTSYLDFNINIIKKWHFQTLFNYDFEFQQLNYNFYLIRKAGRFTIRLSYRSLSKEFLVEIVTG